MQDDDLDAVADLVIDIRHDGDTAVVKLQGDLDVATAPELAEVCDAVHAQGAKEIVIDLADAGFLDSAGLRVLIGVQRLFGDGGANVRLAHPSGAVVRLLDITGLNAYFVIDSAQPA